MPAVLAFLLLFFLAGPSVATESDDPAGLADLERRRQAIREGGTADLPALERAARDLTTVFEIVEAAPANPASVENLKAALRRCSMRWPGSPERVGLAMYHRLRMGTSYFETACLLGSPGTQISESTFAGTTMHMYQWEAPNFGSVT